MRVSVTSIYQDQPMFGEQVINVELEIHDSNGEFGYAELQELFGEALERSNTKEELLEFYNVVHGDNDELV